MPEDNETVKNERQDTAEQQRIKSYRFNFYSKLQNQQILEIKF